jgi:hypothetical protein
MWKDPRIRNAVGTLIAATSLLILLIKVYRGNLQVPMILANIGLLLIAGVFIVGGGSFTKLFKAWLNR